MSPVRRLLGYVLPYRRAYVVGFVCGVVTVAISLAGPWILKNAVDDLIGGVTRGKLLFYASVMLLLAIVGGAFRFCMRSIIVGASRDIEYDLRNDFFSRLLHLDLAYFQHHRTGDLMSRATNDLNAVRMMIGPAVMYTATTALIFVVALGLIFSIDGWLTMLALMPLPFVTLAVRYFGAAIHRRFEMIQAQMSEISAVTQEMLSGVRVVRAYGQEQFELARFRAANDEYVRRNKGLIALMGVYNPNMGLLMGVSTLVVLWQGSQEVVAGRMTMGELVAFNSYLMMLAWPMIAFGWVTNLLQRGMASWKRMLNVLDVEPGITDAEVPVQPAEANVGRAPSAAGIRGDVEFRRLTFAYPTTSATGYGLPTPGSETPDSRPQEPAPNAVLRDISFTVPAGTTTAIVGGTGSGKSTLLNLLPRLHQPPPGTVFIDGVDVRHIPLAELRGAIGFVPQEPFLFSATISENIGFGVHASAPGDDAERVPHMAQIARLDKDVAAFPKGYETMVGERGITLSGGQKQRTAIARALMIDPRILILDDALSSVDTYTEEEILSRLGTIMRQRTSIIVSHRVSTVRGADQIVVLDDGRIVERGTHDELVAANGAYADLYRRQLLEEELAAS